MEIEDIKKIQQGILNLRIKDFQDQELMLELQKLNTAVVDIMSLINPRMKPFEIRDRRFRNNKIKETKGEVK